MKPLSKTQTLIFFNIVIILLLLIITISVINSYFLVNIDTIVKNLISNFQTDFGTFFFLFITLLGKWQVIFSFFIISILMFYFNRRKQYIIPFFITIIGNQGLTYLLKYLIERQRPGTPIYNENFYSFPSGHASIAIAFYLFLTFVLFNENKNYKKIIISIGIILILLLGFSRIYLEVHFLSDVIGGYLVGLIFLSLGIYWITKNNIKENIGNIKQKNKLINYILIAFGVLFYLIFSYIYINNLKIN